MGRGTWCNWSYKRADQCPDHTTGHPHRDVTGALGPDDEPRRSGALVEVWAGDYRRQEVWVASGANIGNWYCLGGEFGRPQVWDPPARPYADMITSREPCPPRPAGTVPLQPTWQDVLGRGPVSLLSTNNQDAYADGWRNGRRDLVYRIESLADDDSGAYGGSAGG